MLKKLQSQEEAMMQQANADPRLAQQKRPIEVEGRPPNRYQGYKPVPPY
jgi:hypothetical protein